MNQENGVAADPVCVWEQDIVIPTYPVQPADANPMFLEKRVYQGSSGKVYPNPFTDRVATEKSDKSYRAIMLENEYVQLMILPEIGGRIHIGMDKTNAYDLFYRQNVIKPALVGLLGPWISGGVEFNWPQHHRPSTYMPVHATIEKSGDGSFTVWLSEHDPMTRMKGMVGICLYPGKSVIEAKVRLFNRTPLQQTFLWWANVGVRVHEQYQAFFPPDVTFVADHAKRAMSSFPVARNFYYGVDYRSGVDISWYKNIPVPTSYMVTKSRYNFFGGYDHAKRAGFVHYSDHHVAPGKKLWTWGNAEFGYAWDRNLTDMDGPYIELMAGAYTDNQPDFSWLQPYETKTFSQIWYPIRDIGPARNANRLLAVNLAFQEGSFQVGVCVTEPMNVRILLTDSGEVLLDQWAGLAPGHAFVEKINALTATGTAAKLEVFDSAGKLLISYLPERVNSEDLPEPEPEPAAPSAIATTEELYLTGLHLEQYRHATRVPELYWLEGLKREPQDARLNNAMGLVELRRGNFAQAAAYFRKAVNRLTKRNPNPLDGEPYYNLGLTLKYMDRTDEAYDAFYKCVWNYALQSQGYYALAAIDIQRGDIPLALEHVDRSLLTNSVNLKARGLKASLLRRLGRENMAALLVTETSTIDPLDVRSMAERFFLSNRGNKETETLSQAFSGDIQMLLDLTYEYAWEGLASESIELLDTLTKATHSEYPLLFYTLADFAKQRGDPELAAEHARRASVAPSLYCFPARLEEMIVLEAASRDYPNDPKAPYYLGNLYYDKRRYDDAIRCWRKSVAVDPGFSIPWRNLGIAEYNILHNDEEAMRMYSHAFSMNPKDARVLYEWDQLKRRVGVSAEERTVFLEQHLHLVNLRDDLMVEYITLLNQEGQPARALELLLNRRFNPWEGGEGLVSSQYVRAHLLLGKNALVTGDAKLALEHFEKARHYPENLGEGKHLLTLERDIDYYSGLAAERLGDRQTATRFYSHAGAELSSISTHSYYRALALRKLGRVQEAEATLHALMAHAHKWKDVEPLPDYFATSLPNFLLFEDDLVKRNQVECLLLVGLAELGLKHPDAARSFLEDVLKLDRNNFIAQQELGLIGRSVQGESLQVTGGNKQ